MGARHEGRGHAARDMTKALIAGKPLPAVLDLAGRLRASRVLRPPQFRACGRLMSLVLFERS